MSRELSWAIKKQRQVFRDLARLPTALVLDRAANDADADAVFPIDNKNVRLGTQAHDRIYLVPLL